MKYLIYCLILSCIFLLSSCTTYYISKESLVKQFSGIDSTNLKYVTVKGPLGEKYNYYANPIQLINCKDENGNVFQLQNNPTIEMRVTKMDDQNIDFYFDRVFLTKTTLYGCQSRFIDSIMDSVKIDQIKKIEIQDGGKKFEYQ